MHRGELGRFGEDVALKFLLKKGLELKEKNFVARHKEIDLVMEGGGRIYFIEVKTRSTDVYGQPFESINRNKIKNIKIAAANYIVKNRINKECIFGVISILYRSADNITIEFFEDTF